MVLITLEGIDGSGKSTLIARLREGLADLKPVFTREPGATWVGEQVRRAVSEGIDPITEALLFTADHAAHLAKVVKPSLQSGLIVISDRYIDSRFAYQSVTLEGVIEDPWGWLRRLHDGWTIYPDLTFLLLLPVKTAMERLRTHPEREHFEDERVLESVQQNYLRLVRENPSRFILIDALMDQVELAAFVEGEIREFAGSSRSRHRS
ncbi:MAG: dTMP kinase [Methanomicrobiales archaeon]|nr:dTMP kinase [Methanomicrobiales archaeon]